MKVQYVVPALAVALLSASCASGGGGSADASGPTPPAPTISQSNAGDSDGGPVRSSRGYIMKDVGEQGGLTSSKDPATNWLTFTVDEIVENDPCDSYEAPSGVPTRVDVSIATADVPEEERGISGAIFHPQSWQWVQADGTTSGVTSQEGTYSYSCGTWQQLSSGLASNSQYRATFYLDVPEGATNLILDHGGGGWEWELP